MARTAGQGEEEEESRARQQRERRESPACHEEEMYELPCAHLLQIGGEWYSVGLASDRREMIEEHGNMRVFVKSIHVFKNSSLGFKFHTKINGECTGLNLVCDQTEKDGKYYVQCRKPDLSSSIKKRFAELCQEHGIVKENVLDLTKAVDLVPKYVLVPTLQIAVSRPEVEEVPPEPPGRYSPVYSYSLESTLSSLVHPKVYSYSLESTLSSLVHPKVYSYSLESTLSSLVHPKVYSYSLESTLTSLVHPKDNGNIHLPEVIRPWISRCLQQKERIYWYQSIQEPRNSGVTGFRHHFVMHGPVRGCVVGGLYGAAAVQSIVETDDCLDFQHVVVAINLSHQCDLDAHRTGGLFPGAVCGRSHLTSAQTPSVWSPWLQDSDWSLLLAQRVLMVGLSLDQCSQLLSGSQSEPSLESGELFSCPFDRGQEESKA
ncbi:hypothetical protein STEG23_015355, partial [Scotinomys teguina]